MKCSLFGHKWSSTMHFFNDLPKPLIGKRQMIEIALSYDICERCGLVQLRTGVVDELNRRIERSRTLHGDLREELVDLRARVEDERALRELKYEEARLRESW